MTNLKSFPAALALVVACGNCSGGGATAVEVDHGEARAAAPAPEPSTEREAAVAFAEAAARNVWVPTTPDRPTCGLASNVTVNVSWRAVSGADEYDVQWSARQGFPKGATQSERVTGTFRNHKARRGAYGAKLPMYYRVVARGAGGESQPSEPCLARLMPSEGGKKCQLCGARSVGYCHLRAIHVCAAHNTFHDDRGASWRCP